MSLFPSASSAGNGALAIALDTNILYESNGTSWLAIAQPGDALTLGAFGTTPNADGLSLSPSGVLSMQPASASFPGGVSTLAQTFAGVKTFSSAPNLSSLTVSQSVFTDGSDNLVSNPITGSGNVVMSISPTLVTPALGTPSALVGTNITGTAAGLTAGTVTTNANLTGDVTSVGNATTLAAVNSNIGTWCALTVNGKGLVTAGANLTGDITSSSGVTTLASVATAGTTGSSTAIPVVTINAKGLTTGISTAAVVAPAGTLSGTVLNSTVVTSSLTALGTIATGVWAGTTVATLHGGTGVTSVTVAPTASSFAGWDANSNLSANNFISAYATTATSAATRTLTVTSAYQQYFTGTTAGQILQLPVTSTLSVTGFGFLVTNNSTQAVTVNSSGSNLILSQAANTTVLYTCILTTGTTAASWFAQVIGAGGAVTPTVSTALNSGTATGTGGFVSGTYTTPANVAWIEVELVGGGGGGAQATGGTPQSGSTGGNTTFGTSLLTANGGVGATTGNMNGGAGGTASITTSSTVIQVAALQGGYGDPNAQNSVVGDSYPAGGGGGTNPFGGGGGGGSPTNNGQNGRTNTGAGGGGGGGSNTATNNSGAGGGAGGYVKAIIYPTAGQTFTYNVGSIGGGGNTGTGAAGGAGGLGAIYVTEYYNNGAIGTATNVTGIVAPANGGTGLTQTVGAYATAQIPTGTITNSYSVAKFGTIAKDTNSAYSTSTGLYTVPVAGWYNVSAMIEVSGTASSVDGFVAMALEKNGTPVAASSVITQITSGPLNLTPTLSQSVFCALNDTLGFYVESSMASPIYGSGLTLSSFSIVRIGN